MKTNNGLMTTKPRIRVLLSDISLMGCQLFEIAFQPRPNIEVVGCAISSEEVVSEAQRLSPDIVLVSSTLKDGPLAGYKALHALSTGAPSCAAVMLLDRYDDELIIDAFRARARGVFYRAHPLDDLVKCVEKVHQGQVWASACELRLLVQALAEFSPFGTQSAGDFLLTKREREIVTLVAGGNTNKQISRRLNLSQHTVKNYLFRIFEKVGVSSRVELAIFVMNHGHLVRPDSERNTRT